MDKVTYEVDAPGARSRKKVNYINLLKNWYSDESEACMVHVHVGWGKNLMMYHHGEMMALSMK